MKEKLQKASKKISALSQETSKLVKASFQKSPLMKKQDCIDVLQDYSDANKDIAYVSENLPYRVFDDTNNIFENTTSIAFMKELGVLAGGTENTVIDLARMVEKLPYGEDYYYEVMIVGNHKISSQLKRNEEAKNADEVSKKRAKEQRIFYEMASSQGFFTDGEDQSSWFDIKDYRVFLAVSYKATPTEHNKLILKETDTKIKASF